jgi:hypothetical protein
MDKLEEWIEGYLVNIKDSVDVNIEILSEDGGIKYSDLEVGDFRVINIDGLGTKFKWSYIKDDFIPLLLMLEIDWDVKGVYLFNNGYTYYSVGELVKDYLDDYSLFDYIWIIVSEKDER